MSVNFSVKLTYWSLTDINTNISADYIDRIRQRSL